jgi:hypothetical protein
MIPLQPTINDGPNTPLTSATPLLRTARATTILIPTPSTARPIPMALPPHLPTAVASQAKVHVVSAIEMMTANVWYNVNLARTGCT